MYPKEFFSRREISEDPGFCFVLMPFADKFQEVWEVIRSVIESKKFNLICKRADDFAKPGPIIEDILLNINKASIIIADLTDRNPNVFYELGIAHCAKNASQVILISQDVEFIPFDLRHLRCIIYKPDLSDLKEGLSGCLREIGIKQYRLSLSEGETQRFPARLAGDKNRLYEVELRADYLGIDAAKVWTTVYQYVAGREPEVVFENGWLLGKPKKEIPVPKLACRLCFGGIKQGKVSIILRKQND